MVPQTKTRRRGFSLIELLIVIAIILIIVTVAVPKLNNARKFAQETAAIKAVQTIHSGEAQYFSQYGKYAGSLLELGPPTSGQAGPQAAEFFARNFMRAFHIDQMGFGRRVERQHLAASEEVAPIDFHFARLRHGKRVLVVRLFLPIFRTPWSFERVLQRCRWRIVPLASLLPGRFRGTIGEFKLFG